MLCPYCLEKIANSSQSCQHCGHEIPPLYRRYYKSHSVNPISLVGFSNHGKTTYIAALFREMGNRLSKVWPGFYRQGIDRESIAKVRAYLSQMEAGILPGSTAPRNFPRPSIHRLVHVPKYGDQQIVIYDAAGESFEEDLRIERYAPFVAKAQSVMLLVSINDLKMPSAEMHRLLDTYLMGMARLRGKTCDQDLIVVYTKADRALDNYLKNWPSIQNYLTSDSNEALKDLQAYCEQLAHISDVLADFTEKELDALNFIRTAEASFTSVKYTIVSALGLQPTGEDFSIWQPIRVVDPLLWSLINTQRKSSRFIQLISRFLTWGEGLLNRQEKISLEPVWFNPSSLQDLTILAVEGSSELYQLKAAQSKFDIAYLVDVSEDIKVALESDSVHSRKRGLANAIVGLKILAKYLSSTGDQEAEKWLLIIKNWQRVLLDSLDKSYKEHFIINPYQAGRPVTLERAALFKGRTEAIELITRTVLAQNAPAIILHGPRRMGKTSLLLNLPNYLPWFIIPVFLDLQRAAATEDVACLLHEISQRIIRYSRIYSQLDIDGCPLENFRKSPFYQFDNWLESSVLPKIKGSKILLCFDEYEKLNRAIRDGRIDERFLDEMRHTIQHRDALKLLFAGVETLEDLGPRWTSYFINAYPLKIGYLSDTESIQLIRNPDPDSDFSLEYSDEAIYSILKLTKGHPFLIQLLCLNIVDLVNEYQAPIVTERFVELARLRAIESGEPYFRNIWDEFTGTDDASISAGRILLQRASVEPIPVNQLSNIPGASIALKRLIHLMILEENDGAIYHQIPLVRDWVLSQAPIE